MLYLADVVVFIIDKWRTLVENNSNQPVDCG